MDWKKVVEYRTEISVDDEDYLVVCRKEPDEEFYAVIVNGDYTAECEELPSYEDLERIIKEDEEIARRTRVGFRIS